MANPADHPVDRLAAIGDPPLPPGLWPRVASARRRQVRNRRAAIGGGILAACVVLLLPMRLPGPGNPPDPATVPPLATAERTASPAASDPAVRLRILDRELQDAYRRGSDEAEIAQLWEARAALLREGTGTLPVRPIRI